MALTRKTVLVTGCSVGGIGIALAEAFRHKGYHVFATARTPSKVPKALAEAQNVTVLSLDVVSPESIAAAQLEVAQATNGRLDVLVNNSGVGMFLPALDTPIEEGKKLFDVNFWGALATIQAFAPLLIKAKGCVVNNTSVNAVLPFPFSSMYNSSKAALMKGSETWRLELAPFGVRTLTLMTGAVKSNFFGNLQPRPLPRESIYSPVKESIEGLGDGKLQESGWNSEDYAIAVVREVERGTSGKFWAGGSATAARLVTWLLPQSMIDKELEKLNPFSDKLTKSIERNDPSFLT